MQMKFKILYIYDLDGWALHNVGKLWLGDESLDVTFVNYNDIKNTAYTELLDSFDWVWFGYQRLWEVMGYYKPDRSIVSIHHLVDGNLNIEKYKQTNIVVTDNALKDYLRSKGLLSYLISTTSLLTPRINCKLTPEEPKLVAICSNDPRKNLDKIRALFAKCEQAGIKTTLKTGNSLLSDQDYLAMLDQSNIYICMSDFEGGPIPAFDAMMRGCVVLTTPVGQIQELVKHGVNGWLLDGDVDVFFDKIMWIKEQSGWLLTGRESAIKTISERTIDDIRTSVAYFLFKLYAHRGDNE